MRRRKKEKNTFHTDESWLLPYTDMVTLLLALFITLYAMSSIDTAKFQSIAQIFNSEFAGGKNNEQLNAALEEFVGEKEKEKEAILEQKVEERLNQLNKAELEEKENLEELKRKFDEYAKQNNLTLTLKSEMTKQGLLITVRDRALFDSGKAEIRPEAARLAEEIGILLEEAMPREIIISGHTDNVPINNEEFDSNWDLSTKRATNFLKTVIAKNKNLDESKFSAIGYGEFRPVAENRTEEGRQKNRRVEVLILPLTSAFKPSPNAK